jgi:2-oxo-4-hydroxy-4-carboxy-5-ureidoimidazoline decarboxylase
LLQSGKPRETPGSRSAKESVKGVLEGAFLGLNEQPGDNAMTEAHEYLNQRTESEARAALLGCCAASAWANAMLSRRPFASRRALQDAATDLWARMSEADLLEAFAGHPQIGGDLEALKQKYASESHAPEWSRAEQAAVEHADEQVLRRLHAANAEYAARFGFIFIVCASGKSALEMLELLEVRLQHSRSDELEIAAEEQAKITLLRLNKLS